MWYRMNTTGTHEYVLEANDGMAVKMVVYRASQDSIHCTVNRFALKNTRRKNNRATGCRSAFIFLKAVPAVRPLYGFPRHRAVWRRNPCPSLFLLNRPVPGISAGPDDGPCCRTGSPWRWDFPVVNQYHLEEPVGYGHPMLSDTLRLFLVVNRAAGNVHRTVFSCPAAAQFF